MNRTVTTIILLILSLNLISEMTQKEIEDAYYSSYNYEQAQNYTKAITVLDKVYKE